MLLTALCDEVFEGLLFLDFDLDCCFSVSGQLVSDIKCMFCFSLRPPGFSLSTLGGGSEVPHMVFPLVANGPGIRLLTKCGACAQCWDRFPNTGGGGGANGPEH